MSKTKYSTLYLIIVITLLLLVAIVNIADKELLAPVADAVKADLGMNDTQLGAVRAAVFISALLGQFVFGPLSDRWVRKNIIAIGALIWSGLTWMTAFVVSFPQMLWARAGMSFAEGCFNPSAYALLTDMVPKKRHGMILGLLSVTYPVGMASALVVASLVGTVNWRKPFVIFGVIGLLLGVLVLIIVREPRRGGSEKAVEAGGEYTGRFSLAEFRQVLKVPSVLLGFGLDTCQASVNWSFAFWAPTYLTRYQIAPDAETAALALLPAILGFVVGALIGGFAIDRWQKRSLMAPVWVATVAMSGGLLAALVVFNVFELTALMTAGFFLGMITYMVMPAVTMIQFSVVPPETKASTISASNILLNSVIAALSFLIGWLSDATELRVAFGGVTIVMFILGIAACLGLTRTFRRDYERRNALVESRVTVV